MNNMMEWAIMFFHSGRIIGQRDFLRDQINVYVGMYGVPTHCVWWMAPDKTETIYQGLTFRLFLYGGKGHVQYIEDFVVERAIYDSVNDMYKIYSISSIFHDLMTSGTFKAGKLTNNKDQPINALNVLKNVIGYLGLNVIATNATERIGYFAFSFDPNFTYLDFITKICYDNKWEWYINGTTLFVSDYFYFKDQHIKMADVEEPVKKEINYGMLKHILVDGETCQPGSTYEDNQYRVLWVIYSVGGEISGLMSVMLQKIINKHLTENRYLNTLFEVSDRLILERKLNQIKQQEVILGKKYGEVTDDNRDDYEAPEFTGDYKSCPKSVKKRQFVERYTKDSPPIIYNKDVIQTSPYAGDGVGMLFPQDEAHHLLFSPYGDREDPLIGPAYWGFNEDVPKRDDKKDFRLQLPNNTAVYYDSESGILYIIANNRLIINTQGVVSSDTDNIPVPNAPKIDMKEQEILLKGGGGRYYIDISNGKLELGPDVTINGNLTVKGQAKASTLATQITPNVDTAIKQKVITPG